VKIAHITTVDMALRYLLLNQLKSLQAAGYEVVGVSAPGPHVAHLGAAGVRHIAVPMTRSFTPLADLVALWKLYRVMRRERFTIVHTHTPKPGLIGQLAARLAGVPVVVNTLHGFYFHDHMPALWRRFYVATEKIAARCSHGILSQSGEDIETAIREGICRADEIRPLGNGIDVRRFDRRNFTAEQLEAKRREVGLPAGAPVVGFVGRLVAEKGILDLLAAAKIILPRRPETKFLIVGPVDRDKADALTPDIAREYGVAEACVFTGLREDTPELYALMDVFALPSYREGFPRSPMEASAAGVPSVVTNVRGCREAVRQGENGLLVPPAEPQALADAILQLLDQPDAARAMGGAGRRMALERFDEELVFERVKAEYARLLAAKGLSAPEPKSVRAGGTGFSLRGLARTASTE
jgi:glycosyltransferase involved in cell wall biosynthesis